MKELSKYIKNFISDMSKNFNLFPYLYNDKKEGFQPGKDWVYYSGPFWDMDEKTAIIEAILTGKWLSSGSYVYNFEKQFSNKFNLNHSVMVNSGSSANLIMIGALKKYFNWSDKSEVILSPVGFPTTLTPIIQYNMKPVFIDVSIDDLNFNVNEIEKKITKNTRAIFLSPVLGNPPDVDIIISLLDKYNLKLILDNCDSLGSKWKEKYLNEYAVASSCSFYPAHHITTGEGGMISSNNEEIIQIARSLSSWGGDCHCVGSGNLLPNGTCGKRFSKWLTKYDGLVDHRYLFTNIGYNLKPLDLQGALGTAQLNKFDVIVKKRREIKDKLSTIFEKYIPNIKILKELEFANTSWFGVGIICETKKLKRELVSFLEKNKIQTRNYMAGNLLLHPAFDNLDNALDYTNSNLVMDKMFFIGCSPTFTNEMIDYIVDTIKNFSNQ